MKTWSRVGFTVSQLRTILGSNFLVFLSPTSHGVCWACHACPFSLIKAIKWCEWSGQCYVMHADMTGDMIACQLALNHFVVLFVQNNSQMPRISYFKNVFLPNRGKKAMLRVFESRNNFRLPFFTTNFSPLLLSWHEIAGQSRRRSPFMIRIYRLGLIKVGNADKARGGGERGEGKMEKKSCPSGHKKKSGKRIIGLATYFTPPAANHLIRTRVRWFSFKEYCYISYI